MYNEVHKRCYNCGARCTIQIPQVVLGFGDFNLDNPTSIEDLTPQEKKKLAEYVNRESFYCGHDSCNSAFEVELMVEDGNKPTKVII